MEIRLEGASAVPLPEEEIVRLGLEPGRIVTRRELDGLRLASERAEAMRIGLRYLSVRPRSRREVEVRLRRDGLGDEAISAAADRLAEMGYLDDRKFAAAFARDRIRLRPCGARRLRSELRCKGVAPSDAERGIEEAFAEEDVTEVELLERVATARAGRLTGEDPDRDRRRLYGFLVRRGFDPGGVRLWLDGWAGGGRRGSA